MDTALLSGSMGKPPLTDPGPVTTRERGSKSKFLAFDL